VHLLKIQRLPELLKSACLLTMPDGYAAVLADAADLPGPRLWFFEAFGENNQHEHAISFDRAEDTGYWINLWRGRSLVASLGPASDEKEAAAVWEAWRSFLETSDGRYAAHSIADMKRASIEWR